MMRFFADRSHATEIMDDLSVSGEEIRRTLDSLEHVNRWLGGTRVLVGGLDVAFARGGFDRVKRPLTLVDLGCGGGDGLRAAARWARHRGIPLALRGVDANPFIVEHARSRLDRYPEITVEQGDVQDPALELSGTDIVTLNLFLHHFSEPEISSLLERFRVAGVRAIVINDLHRHWLAYVLFPVACLIFRSPRVARVDGLISIRKGFRRPELVSLIPSLRPEHVHLRWRWAFRYQLVLILARSAETEAETGRHV